MLSFLNFWKEKDYSVKVIIDKSNFLFLKENKAFIATQNSYRSFEDKFKSICDDNR